MPQPTWDQLMQLISQLGVCGVTLIVLVLHMAQEERHRRRMERCLDAEDRKGE